jgi:hypothetical protein
MSARSKSLAIGLLDDVEKRGPAAVIADLLKMLWAMQDERDEARRRYVRAWTYEHGSLTMDLLVVAARTWGREVALALYSDDDLRRSIVSDLGLDEGTLGQWDEEEIQDRIAENHRRLDEQFPEAQP